MPRDTLDLASTDISSMTKDDVEDIMGDISDEEGKIFDDPPAAKPDDKNDDPPKNDDDPEDKKDDPPADNSDDEDVLDTDDLIDDIAGIEPKVDKDKEEQDKKDEELLKGANEDQQAAFKTMREKINDLEAKIESGDDSETVKELRQKINDLEGQLGQIDITKDPEFKRKHTTPIRNELKTIAAAVKNVGGDPDAIVNKALTFKSLIERKKYLTEVIPEFAGELSFMFTKVDGMIRSRKEAMQDHVAERERLSQQAARDEQETLGTLFDESLAAVRKDNHFMYANSSEEKKSEKWDASVAARIDRAKTSVSESLQDRSKLTTMALKAEMADELRDLYLKQRKELKALQKNLGIRKSASPNLGGDSLSKLTKSGKIPNEMDADSAADAVLGRDSRY